MAWATAVYVPSLAIAFLSLSPLASRGSLFVDTFEVADEVSPAAKLTYAILLGALLILARSRGVRSGLSINILIGTVSMALAVALLPEYWSRGFGIGLNGIRFDPLPSAIYLFGGIASGVVFTLTEARCRSRSLKAAVRKLADD
jgi:hypothetical protein